MKKILSFCLALFFSVQAFSYDFEVDGIYYNFLGGDSVEITAMSHNYSGFVTLPEKVFYSNNLYRITSIGRGALMNCTNLIAITIPNSITTINSYAFDGCSNLTSLSIGENVISIGSSVFNNCKKLTSIIWNAKNHRQSSASRSIFSNIASQITSFTFGDKVQHISAHLCEGMKLLDTIKIPNNVLSIGERAFRNCSNIKEIIIPDSVISIGYATFENCSSLESITIGECVRIFDNNNIFYGCWNLSSIVWKAIRCNDFAILNETPFYISNCYDIRSSIKSFTFGENVEYIPKNLCKGMKNITNITLGNSIKTIGYSAFSELRLDSIIIPNNVDSICGHAFSGCGNLSFIEVPNNLLHLGDFAFSGCQFTQFHIPESLGYIPMGCFNKCSRLTTIILPNNIKEVQKFAFENCTSLEKIQTNNNLEYIASSAFENCTALVSFTVPINVQSIENCAFKGCTSLDTIVWNAKKCQGFESEDTPFLYWKSTYNSENFDISMNIRSITFGDSVENIPDCLCGFLSGITNISLPNSVKKIGRCAFSGCSNLSTISMGNQIDSIGASAFAGCRLLTKIDIPDSVKFIGEGAFWVCDGLQSIIIGSGIDYIAERAFLECPKLSSIKITALEPPALGEDAFNYSKHSQIPVDVPCDALNAYQTANNGWCQFKNYTTTFPYIFSVIVEDDTQGSCEIITAPTCENEAFATFKAIPAENYKFVQWNDGNTANPRTVEVIEDVEYMAIFGLINDAVDYVITNTYLLVHKVLKNGTIYILRNGEKYTIDGRKVE